ncbi:hypothetical protein MSEDJ_57040 [Mycolicibacterium sediminis]|uniref:Sensor protein KdpD n=1 Tax=Mycolicibacterium sediminis TaxID=1286180 RepID=A0A7I7QZ43_9MYCO|nr:hypothetical protein MSEDJ_57040 [Mycolicibacterium sediminis]
MSTTPPSPRKRGELRVYLGAAPGVGKTYAMLGEAHRRLERGTDVVAAVVETHGRAKTAERLDGIEVIPPRQVSYRGREFGELDVDAVLRRAPQVVLVDELAHTNTPGSRNAKRWQDVEELLAAGITVVSTVNVQHLESLNDVVAQITGIEQQETVPDEIVRHADQIELVDITPEALQRRLSHGNVYASDRVDAALSNYFRRGNLTALRELALLWLADQVDAALSKYRADNRITDTWEARERVVVAVTGGPESETLVRRAFRIASKSSAELMVVHVVRGDGLTGVSAGQMGGVREVATSLGATLHTVVGDDVSTALLDFARERNATQLVLGISRRSRWARILDEGIGAATVRESGKIDVHMVTHGEVNSGWSWSALSARQRHLTSWLAALVVPSTICAIAVLLVDRFLGIGGERAVLRRRAHRGAARRCRTRRPVGGVLRSAAELLPRRTPLHVHDLGTRQRGHDRRPARRRGRGGRAGRRRRQPHAGGPTGVPGGRVARPVRGFRTPRRRPARPPRARPGDVLAARGQPRSRAWRGGGVRGRTAMRGRRFRRHRDRGG